MKIRRLARMLLATVAVAGIGTVVAAAPASAAVIRVDPVLLNAPVIDFGAGGFAGGAPAGPGAWVWQTNGVGDLQPALVGSIYVLNAPAPTCARMELNYYNAAGVLLANRVGNTYCAPAAAGLAVFATGMAPYIDNTIWTVQISTTRAVAAGVFVPVSSLVVSR